MANKKLRLEVELETAKAKRQAQQIAAEGSASPAGAGVATVSPAATRATRQIQDLGSAAERSGINMKAASKAFVGMAGGLAASYAAKNMKPGGARDAVEYGGAAVSGAAMGMMFGPIGAAIGGLAGVMKTFMDKQSERQDMIKDYEQGESIYQSSRAQMKKFKDLTDPRKNGGDISGNVTEMKRISENYKKSTEAFLKMIAEELEKASPDAERISTLKRNVDWARAMADRYDEAVENVELKEKDKAFRGSTSGLDSLAKVGGNIYGAPAVAAAAEAAAPAVAAAAEAAAPAVAAAAEAAAPAATASSGVRGFGFSVPARKASVMNFGGPDNTTEVDKAIKTATEHSAKLDQEMVDLLKSIKTNTEGGESWQ